MTSETEQRAPAELLSNISPSGKYVYGYGPRGGGTRNGSNSMTISDDDGELAMHRDRSSDEHPFYVELQDSGPYKVRALVNHTEADAKLLMVARIADQVVEQVLDRIQPKSEMSDFEEYDASFKFTISGTTHLDVAILEAEKNVRHVLHCTGDHDLDRIQSFFDGVKTGSADFSQLQQEQRLFLRQFFDVLLRRS